MPDNLDEPTYTISEIAAATCVQANTIRTWFRRGHILAPKNHKQPGPDGLPHRFSARTALAIGIMGDLVKMGLHVRRAKFAAERFAFSGNPSGGWVGDTVPRKAGRLPGKLFDQGSTILIVPASEDAPSSASVLQMEPGDSFLNINTTAVFGENQPFGGTFLELDELVQRINVMLDRLRPEGTAGPSRKKVREIA